MSSTIDLDKLNQVQLNNIVQVEYNQDTLKNNFSIIVDLLKKLQEKQQRDCEKCKGHEQAIKELQDKTNRLERDNSDNQQDIKQLKFENNDLKDEIQKLKERADKQESEHQQLKGEHELAKERIAQNEKDIEELRKNVKVLLDKLRDLENQYNDLKKDVDKLKFAPATQGSGVDSSALQNLLDELEKMRDQFVTKQDFNDKCKDYDRQIGNINDQIEEILKRLNDLESKIQDLSDRVDNIQSKINNLGTGGSSIDQAEIDQLREMIKKRVDHEKFDREINSLKKLIQQLSNIGDGKEVQIMQGGLSEEDKQMIDNLRERMEDLEDLVKKLRRDVDSNKNEYNQNKQVTDKRLDDLENQMNNKLSKEDLKQINTQISQLFGDLEQTTELAKENERNIKQLKKNIASLSENNGGNNNMNYGGISDGVSEELVDEKIRKCKEELLNLLKALQEEKVSFDDLWKSEAVILEKLDEVAGALLKKLADRQETKKALVYMEKKINQIYMMLNKNGERDGDGLLVKRPLLWSCISCDKDLNKFQGRMGDFKSWAVFPPKETTPERMGKYGIGYKSLMEKSKMREEKLRMESAQMQQQQQDQLPQLNKTPGLGTSGQAYEQQ